MALVGRFDIIDRFAVGGMADIFRARDTRDNSPVVIKRLRADRQSQPDAVRAFHQEIEIHLLMQHPNIVRAVEAGSLGDREHLVLEFVAGHTLADIMERAGQVNATLPHAFALYIVAELLGALHHAHTLAVDGMPLGIVHRDVTPRNVFISYDGQVKLADFGAVRSARNQKQEAVMFGSPGYLSPEQAEQSALDCRSDVFAVACILLELLTGQRALDVAHLPDSEVLSVHKNPRILLDTNLPDDVVTTIARATATSARARHPDALAMELEVRESLAALNLPVDHRAMKLLTRTLFRREYAASFVPPLPRQDVSPHS